MKSAYELAMERFAGDKPAIKLTDDQRDELATIDAEYRAKSAERELFLDGLLAKAISSGNYGEIAEIKEQRTREVHKFDEQREAAKEKRRAEWA